MRINDLSATWIDVKENQPPTPKDLVDVKSYLVITDDGITIAYYRTTRAWKCHNEDEILEVKYWLSMPHNEKDK